MLTVEHYARIRRSHRDGRSIQEMAKKFGHSRRKIRQVLKESEPRPYARTKVPSTPILGPFAAFIDEILKGDETVPRKQRHSAVKIHRRLAAEHGSSGKYDQVTRYVARQRRRECETFIPLSHDPGQRMERDFGQIHVDFPTGRRAVDVLPPSFATLREKLEAEHGPQAGARQFIRVLLLLHEHPVERVQAALDQLVPGETLAVDATINCTQRLAARQECSRVEPFVLPATVPDMQVPMPYLQRFNLVSILWRFRVP